MFSCLIILTTSEKGYQILRKEEKYVKTEKKEFIVFANILNILRIKLV